MLKTESRGLAFSEIASKLRAYVDADFAGDQDNHQSITGFVCLLNEGPISWNSRLHPTVPLSISEAEYISATAGVKEVVWLKTSFHDIDLSSWKLLVIIKLQLN